MLYCIYQLSIMDWFPLKIICFIIILGIKKLQGMCLSATFWHIHHSSLKTDYNLWSIRGHFCLGEPPINTLMFPPFCQRVGGGHFKQLDSWKVLNSRTTNESEPLWQFTWRQRNAVIYLNSHICKCYPLTENQNTCFVGGLWIQMVLHFWKRRTIRKSDSWHKWDYWHCGQGHQPFFLNGKKWRINESTVLGTHSSRAAAPQKVWQTCHK